MTGKQTAICAAALWVGSLALASLVILPSGMQIAELRGRGLKFCMVDGPFDSRTARGRLLAYTAGIGSFLAPALFLFCVYGKIIRLVCISPGFFVFNVRG